MQYAGSNNDGGSPASGRDLYDNNIAGRKAGRVFVINRDASMTAVRHLLDIGHRRAGVVTGELSDTAANERYLGYCDALTEHGLKIDPQYVVSSLGPCWEVIARLTV